MGSRSCLEEGVPLPQLGSSYCNWITSSEGSVARQPPARVRPRPHAVHKADRSKMKRGPALVFMLFLVTKTPDASPNQLECKESQYVDEHGKCVPCKECGPGWELSKECGYGEGRDAHCTACPPRKFKESWGHHGCKTCLSCILINRVQKSNCTAISNAACGECLPGFYSKGRIGGMQDLECIPCTKQTPSSEPQCSSRTNLKAAGSEVHPLHKADPLLRASTPDKSTAPPQDTALLALTSSALVIIALVLLALSIIYCRRFWKCQGQRVFLRTQNFSGQRAMFQASAAPGRFPCEEQMTSPCCLGMKKLSPCYRQAEGPAEVIQFISDGETVGLQFPAAHHDLELSQVDDTQSLVTGITSTTQGLPIAELPHSLVLSLGFQLDPSLPGLKNFSHVGMELGVPAHLVSKMSGFEQLVTHLTSSGDTVTVPVLARALQQLHRFDALLLLCDHFAVS
ncbi:tumor necrosis factor receptor superfamily member 27 isoform A [Alligator mississippiensis]|uniref:Tumor necrosis factor receptor superfamily member 27 isoform A n=1 Tax=Alligator mississippiensis TaxID=8496 RepID=A0A151NNE8_ALLMI|nr:tumor necrosis factor receptor superfamily member 27 isoform A [Alligator mississippiensis]